MIIIRKAVSADAGVLLNLIIEVERSGWMLHAPEERSSSIKKLVEQMEHLTEIYIYIMDDTPVGYLLMTRNINRRNRHTISVELGVEKQFRRNGIGSKLLQKCLLVAESKKICRIEAGIIAHNQKALNLFHKFDFFKEGERIDSFLINNRFVNEVLLAKIIKKDNAAESQ